MSNALLDALEDRFLEPTDALAAGDDVLSAAQVNAWRQTGCTVVNGVLPQALISQLREDAQAHFPEPGSDASGKFVQFGSAFVFPAFPPKAATSAFNDITLHPRLLRANAQLLGVASTDLRLTQSDLWPKYGRDGPSPGSYDNQDQRIHVDYPNHMLTHPTPWERPAAVEMIVYLDDVTDCGGPTAVVPRTGSDDPAYPWPIVDSPGIGGLRYVNDRERAERYMAEERPEAAAFREQLYARERYVRFAPGTILFYRHDAWHRGTPMIPGTLRLAHNLTYRRADCDWISTLHVGWAWQMPSTL